MTALRQRFIDDLQLQGLSARTQQAYVRAVRMFAQHYGKSPDLITEEELRQDFLYVKNVKKTSPGDSDGGGSPADSAHRPAAPLPGLSDHHLRHAPARSGRQSPPDSGLSRP